MDRRAASRAVAIADALAGPGYIVVDGFLGERRARALANALVAAREAGRFEPAAVGVDRRRLDDVRGDSTFWLDGDTAPRAALPLLAALEDLRVGLRRALLLPLEEIECHAACYPPGAFYAAHVDDLRGSAGRRVSFVWYANPDWTADLGGALRLDGDEVLPVLDRLVVFRSLDVDHEVRPTARDRYSITGWMRLRRATGVAVPQSGP